MMGYRGTFTIQPRAGWIVTTDKAERRNRRLAERFNPSLKERTMTKIVDWLVKRSGAQMTIIGKDEAGNPRKIAATSIASVKGQAVATTPDGARFVLA